MIRGIKMSNRRFKYTPQLSELRNLNIIERSSISFPLILDSLFACGIKNTLYNVLIFDMDTFNPHPPIRFKVTEVYRKGPRVLKQGQSKFFSQAMTHTHTKSQTQNKNSRKFEAEYMSCNLLSL